ncbi:MAG: fumarylacetoacetate hydrolase family protein [Alphaproteobacteria bacterium]
MASKNSGVDPATGLREGTFGIGTFAASSRKFPGIVKPGGSIIDVSAHFADTHTIFENWDENFEALSKIALQTHSEYSFGDVRVLPPLEHPNLLGAGANYRVHVAEILTHGIHNQHNRKPGESDAEFYQRNLEFVDRRGREGIPFLFTSLHSALAGAYDDIVLPPIGIQHDWELELGIVVGKTARFATLEQARSLIAGYVVVNDIGTLDQLFRTDMPWKIDFIPKDQPTFKVCGPFIVPARFVDLSEMRIQLSVNGEVKQDWPVDDMVFSIEKLLAYASERVRLMPGDILHCGSPPGNGSIHGQFLKSGDLVESAITYLGRQRNSCVVENVPATGMVFGPNRKSEFWVAS